jgi:hypothetical protein
MHRQKVHVLVVVDGPMVGERYPLLNILSTLGRASTNTVVLESAQISRLHAQIRLQPIGTTIEDMGSVNGTFVNGHRLTAPSILSPGDLIRFAEFATLQYVVLERDDVAWATPVGPESSTRGAAVSAPQASPSYERTASLSQTARPSVAYEPGTPPRAPVDRGTAHTVAPAGQPASRATEARPSTWIYGVIVILLVLICLCIALAVYLWTAPVTFWERLYSLLGVPLPSGVIGSLVSNAVALGCCLSF